MTNGPDVEPQRAFAARYARAVFAAALAFGLVHGAETLTVSMYRDSVLHPRFSAMLVLVSYELLQALVFVAVGTVAALLPARFLDGYLAPTAPARGLRFLSLGALAGLIFLPICAAVSVSIMPEQDDPTFLQRCGEYLVPMAAAGIIGCYVFSSGRTARRASR